VANRAYAVNVRAQFALIQQLLSALRAGSSVVLMPPTSTASASSSGADFSVDDKRNAVSERAVSMCVRQLASLLKGRGVRVKPNSSAQVRSSASITSAYTASFIRYW